MVAVLGLKMRMTIVSLLGLVCFLFLLGLLPDEANAYKPKRFERIETIGPWLHLYKDHKADRCFITADHTGLMPWPCVENTP